MTGSAASRALRTKSRLRSRDAEDLQEYFTAVAQVRYIMRKVFRMIDDDAKKLGLDPLAHQALLQVYGSGKRGLRVSALAERLDIAPSFASNIVKHLVTEKLLRRGSDVSDMRAAVVTLTSEGRELCRDVDAQARVRVDALISRLEPEERKVARSILMFYTGPGAVRRTVNGKGAGRSAPARQRSAG
ncbi:MarR family transcriptional regulator [Rhodoplanes sp. Z2-YC6860]|nr:MarR family transcriptional regulator [Rhodoplanes sp. Z2-YC6860]